ncbi:hypothetical protein [Hyalangium versicolor]|uniref:hypothetical protein n=1 Tax=Hyalangium versicolor TaxID=2861190 RepID=UPI001CCFB9DC|nr:hypothetical protein [Hyalangium versicolor]
MGRPAADEYRLRLEGRAELLESARFRYRALLDALNAKNSEERLRKDRALLREMRDSQVKVDEALTAALRRAQAESWLASSPTVQLLRDVQALRGKLVQTVAQRLSRSPADPIVTLLEQLDEWALTAPRELAPAQRWATALELLPDELPLVSELASFGRLLATLFARPFDPEAPLPFRVDEVGMLRSQWSPGEVAVAQAWSRLSGVDRTGGLIGELRKRAERAPLHPPRNGPEHLLCAEYWRIVARRQLELLVRTRLYPLQPTPGECVKVAWWLCARELVPEARLPGSEVASDARAGLIELAHELWLLLRPDRAEDPPRLSDTDWERLRERSLRADQLTQGPEADRVRDVLRTFIWKRGMGNAGMRGWQESGTRLEGLVEQAWSVDR